MDVSERASSSVPSRQPPRKRIGLFDGTSSDDCEFCGATLDPAKLVVNLKSGAVIVRCDRCAEVKTLGVIRKETLQAELGVQQPSTSAEKTKKHPISFQCPHCPKSFSLNFGLKRHILAAHPTTVDEKDLRKTENKSKGLISCCKNGMYRCPLCHKTFAHKLDLKTHTLNASNHMMLHNKNKRMKLCKLCGREFQRQKTLIAHIRVNHRIKKVKVSSNDSVEEMKGASHDNSQTGGKLFVCAYCSKKFPWNYLLVRHTRTHTGEKPFECKNCAKKYFHKGHLDKHTRLHHMEEAEKDLECNHCGKKYANNFDLRYHITRIHTKPFECNHCDKKCGTKHELDRHLKAHHTGERPYECKICGKCVVRRENLERHEKALHGAGKVQQ